MKKLLHERLRSFRNKFRATIDVLVSEDETNWFNLFDKWADEIENNYIQIPRYEDGEPVEFGDSGIIWVDTDHHDNNRNLFASAISFDGIPIAIAGDAIVARAVMVNGEFVKSEYQKIYDEDGVETKVDDAVWLNRKGCIIFNLHSSPQYVVKDITTSYLSILIIGTDGKEIKVSPGWITHKEPDSLEKLLDDIRKWLPKYSSSTPYETVESIGDEIEARLTALIERGA